MSANKEARSRASFIQAMYLLFQLQCIVLVIMGLISVAVMANAATQAEMNTNGKQFAEGLKSSVASHASNPTYTDIPQYQGENVPEKSLYGDQNLEDNAAQKVESDPTMGFVVDSHFSRPVATIDRANDPLFTHEKDIEDLSLSLTETYSGCVALPIGDETNAGYIDRTCSVTGMYYKETPTCTESYTDPKPISVSARIASKGRDWVTMQVDFSQGSWQVIAPSDGIAHGALLTNFDGTQYCGAYETTIGFNGISHWTGAPGYVGGGPYDDTVRQRVLQHPSCNNGMVGIFQVEDRSKGSDTNYVLGATYGYTFTTYNKNYSCSTSEAYTANTLISRICTDSADRLVNGILVHRDCWNWVSTYEVEKFQHIESADCDSFRQQGCGYIGTNCLAKDPNGNCLNEETHFKCPTSTATKYVDLCASVMSCPDGDCTTEYQTSQDATEQFKEAATSLAVAGEIAEEFDINDISIFTGKDLSCDRKAFGISNCCKDSGWGQDIGVSECSAEEKELGLAREKGMTHYVGSYCSDDDDILGCLEREYVYCSYPSKLSRIIIEQGNMQLNRDYGSPRNPDCEGFTIDELQGLNFNAMDLSEFYVDVMDKAQDATIPNSQQLAQELAQKLQQKQGNQ